MDKDFKYIPMDHSFQDILLKIKKMEKADFSGSTGKFMMGNGLMIENMEAGNGQLIIPSPMSGNGKTIKFKVLVC